MPDDRIAKMFKLFGLQDFSKLEVGALDTIAKEGEAKLPVTFVLSTAYLESEESAASAKRHKRFWFEEQIDAVYRRGMETGRVFDFSGILQDVLSMPLGDFLDNFMWSAQPFVSPIKLPVPDITFVNIPGMTLKEVIKP
jgi:hypothetical protein